MKKIALPKSNLSVTPSFFGTSRLGGTIDHFDKKEALGLLHSALEGGINTIDTADLYGQGNSEKLIGKVLKGQRDQVIIATKGGYQMSAKLRWLKGLKPIVRKLVKRSGSLAKAAGAARGSQIRQNFSPEYLANAVEQSLRRLNTDYIDLYQLHSPDSETLRRGEAFEALAKLKKEGKIRAFGASLLSWSDLTHCMGHGLSMVQLEADLLGGGDRSAEITAAKNDELMLVARQPFASGLFARSPDQWEPADFAGDEGRLKIARERFEKLTSLGDIYEVILRYLIHHSSFPCFLFATTKTSHLESNLKMMAGTPFEGDELEILKNAFSVNL
ncbi:aldo/keto reductase [Akkermansiaceae bacterium]|nr:aldo/keto reductase [Akkermansiaceae bacterium]MDA7611662.1 aldo/keto reductase [bacterium]MDA7519079.1 aldo/keto reductase [Akkermansiaceae bacterium]MDB4305365.1 aldo/keto reductase [Akkermansiaceae bacterium]MDB4411854.1 aldo/keto reductase [Akkermansiaceae bacterium]